MKKIFTILPMIGVILGAVAIATEVKTTNPIPVGQQMSGAIVTCVKTALEKRETAIISAVIMYQTHEISALNTRKTALLTAWNVSSKLAAKSAISAAWKTYKTSITDDKSTLSTARKGAWTTYKDAVKACNGTSLVQNIDTSSLSNEQQ